jgi:hypothetical protein
MRWFRETFPVKKPQEPLKPETKEPSLRVLATLGDGTPVEMFDQAIRGTLPADVDWSIATPSGWTLAHEAARYGQLPPDFDQWHLKDKDGLTVMRVLVGWMRERRASARSFRRNVRESLVERCG